MLQAGQRNVENGHIVHENAGLRQKRESPAAAFSGFFPECSYCVLSIGSNRGGGKKLYVVECTIRCCCTASVKSLL